MAEVTLEQAPRKARELFDKGFAAMERGNLDYAMDMFMGALDLEPKLLSARKYLRAAQIKKKGKPGALAHALSSLAGFPQLLSVMSTAKKKPQAALKTIEKLLRQDPLNLTFLNLLDQTACAAGMPEVAVQSLEVAKEHYPRDVKLIERLGMLYLDLNETQKAKGCFEDLVRLRPKDQRALKLLKDSAALDTMRSGGWEGAKSYRDVMKDAKEAEVLEQQSKAVRAESGLDSLIQDTLAKIEREPQNVNYKRALADLYARAHRYDDAIRLLEETFRATGGADPEVEKALTLAKARKYDHEIQTLAEAGQQTEADALTREKDEFLFANAQDRVRRYPNDLMFKYDLGVMLFDRGELNEAIRQFQQSHRNPQRRIRSLYYLALCFKGKNQFDLAAEQLEKAASELPIMDDTKKDVLYDLAGIYEQMGQGEKAVALYKQIYAVDIGFKDVSARIEKGRN